MQPAADNTKRTILRRLTMAMFLVGAVALLIPFTSSLTTGPEAGLPVMKVNVSDMRAGEFRSLVWNGWPVFILRRTPAMIGELAVPDGRIRDPRSLASQQPDAARNSYRSIKPDYMVA